MPEIKATRIIAEKWARVTPGRTRDYSDGIAAPRRDWEQATVAANDAWEQGLQEAMARDAFRSGVVRAGTAKWQAKTLQKGPTRWAEGVRMSEIDFRSGFDPYRDEIERIDLPPRYARGDERNMERVAVIARALHALRLRLEGGGR